MDRLSPLVQSHFQITDPELIYPYAPVYRAVWQEQSVVLKTTRFPLERAQVLQKWLRSLPAGLSLEALAEPWCEDEQAWVLYPFIEGEAYSGLPDQIAQAGDLLGCLHQSTLDLGLPSYDWPLQDLESIQEDLQGLEALASQENLQLESQLIQESLKQAAQIRSCLMAAALPMVNASWDYKANNLVYQTHGPLLIDPDSAGYLPRILDLALTVWLFHNEHLSAPARLWTQQEWLVFLKAYSQQIDLTPIEIRLWPEALRWMFLEEAVWLLLADPAGWKEVHQGRFLRHLAKGFQDLKLYSLD